MKVDFSSGGRAAAVRGGTTLNTLEWFRTLERLSLGTSRHGKAAGLLLGTLHVLYPQSALSIYRVLTSETLHIIIKKENGCFNFKYPVISKGGIKTDPEHHKPSYKHKSEMTNGINKTCV